MAVKVLVVDDDNDVRAMVVDVLHMDPGITVIEAVDGRDAVDLAGRERPQVVVTDIMMPRMDGLEATRQIKRAWPETRVIVVSAFTQDAYRTAASERGADAFIAKYDMSTLLLPLVHKLTQGDTSRTTAPPPHTGDDPEHAREQWLSPDLAGSSRAPAAGSGSARQSGRRGQ
jgi:NarL family two-component system response regulator LiaR